MLDTIIPTNGTMAIRFGKTDSNSELIFTASILVSEIEKFLRKLQQRIWLGTVFDRHDYGATRIAWQYAFNAYQFWRSCFTSSVSNIWSLPVAETVRHVLWNIAGIRSRMPVLSMVFRNNQRTISTALPHKTNAIRFTWKIFEEDQGKNKLKIVMRIILNMSNSYVFDSNQIEFYVFKGKIEFLNSLSEIKWRIKTFDLKFVGLLFFLMQLKMYAYLRKDYSIVRKDRCRSSRLEARSA